MRTMSNGAIYLTDGMPTRLIKTRRNDTWAEYEVSVCTNSEFFYFLGNVSVSNGEWYGFHGEGAAIGAVAAGVANALSAPIRRRKEP
jgi:hypothetical protein